MILVEKVQALIDKAKKFNMFWRWLTATEESPYDFKNVWGVNTLETNFMWNTFERSIIDNYQNEIVNNEFSAQKMIENITMPNVSVMGLNAILNTKSLTTMEVGTLTSTTATSFKQVSRGTAGALEVLKVGKGTSANLYIQYSVNYSTETLHAIIENLADMTGQDAPYFNVGPDNIAKIDEEHLTMLDNKNWLYM